MYKFKKIMFAAITLFMLFSFTTLPTPFNPGGPASSIKTTANPKTVWAKDVHDFGQIPQGKPVSIEFTFTNNGDAPLVITDVQTSCGCTVPDFPKEPIAAGKSSKIKVSYNAAAMGAFTKTITVRSNDVEEAKVLTIRGTVK
jgi:hypothetical protein